MSLKTILSVALLCAACGDDVADPVGATGPEGALALRVGEGELFATPDGGAHIALEIIRDEVTEPVTLAIAGLPDGVTAVFDANPSTTGAVALDFVVAHEAAGGLYPLHVIARADTATGLVKATALLSLRVIPTSRVHVRGRVVDTYDQPVSGVAVAIGSSVTTTGLDGGFAIPGLVSPPYDITVREAASVFHVYRGLTTGQAVLQLAPFVVVDLQRHATLMASVANGGASATKQSVVAFAAPDGWGGGAPGAVPITWYGDPTVTGTLHAVEYDLDAVGQPSQYTGYGYTQVTLASGASTGADVVLEPVGTSWIAAEVDLAAGVTLTERTLWWQLGERTAVPLATSHLPNTAFTWAVPDLAATFGVLLGSVANGRQSYRYVAGIEPGELIKTSLASPPSRVNPANGSVVTKAEAFTSTSTARAVHAFVFLAPGLAVAAYTAEDAVVFPESTALGLGWPAGASVSWYVAAIGPYASLDAYVSADGGLGFFGLGRDVTLGYSELGSFTALP